MSILSIICFIIFFTLIATSLFGGKDLFSPARIFSIIWTLALGLTDLKLSRFQLEWSFYSFYALAVALSSFLLGCFVVYTINYGNKIYSLSRIKNRFSHIKIDSKRFLLIILLIFILYIISYIVNTLATVIYLFFPVIQQN